MSHLMIPVSGASMLRPYAAGIGLRVYGSGSSYAGLKSPATGPGIDWVLPTADGSIGQFLKTDGSGNLAFATASGGAGGANPSASVGLVAVNGSAGTFLRSDGAPALDQTIAPTMTGAWNWTQSSTSTTPVTIQTAATPTVAGLIVNTPTIGTTSAPGSRLDNATAAGAGAQQYSSRFEQGGKGWKTNATAGSQDVRFGREVRPVQGTANPSANWALMSNINAAGWNDRLLVNSDGAMSSGNNPQFNANPPAADLPHFWDYVNDGSTTYQCFRVTTYGGASLAGQNNFHWCSMGGTLASPSATQLNDFFMSNGYRGYGTNTPGQSVAAFQCYATENFTNSAQGTAFRFENAITGTNTRKTILGISGTGVVAQIGSSGSTFIAAAPMHVLTNAAGSSTGLIIQNAHGSANDTMNIDFVPSASSGDAARARILAKRTNSPSNGDTELEFWTNQSGTLTQALTITTAGALSFVEAANMIFGTTTGTKIGTVGGASGQKIGFFNATPIVQPLLATGGGATVDNVITALQNLGLVRQS